MNINFKQLEKNAPKAAKLLKSIGHAERLMILCQLLEGERCVGELWNASNLSQSALSQHLAILRRENLVKTRKEAQTVYYQIACHKTQAILKTLHKLFC